MTKNNNNNRHNRKNEYKSNEYNKFKPPNNVFNKGQQQQQQKYKPQSPVRQQSFRQNERKIIQNTNIIKPTIEILSNKIVTDNMQWQSSSRSGPGLINHGNTCFLNSTLQCLLHTPALTQILLKESKLALRSLDQGNHQNSMTRIYKK